MGEPSHFSRIQKGMTVCDSKLTTICSFKPMINNGTREVGLLYCQG